MKIMYINTFYSPHIGGGAEMTLKSLVEGVKAKGHEVVVLSTVSEKGISVDYVDGVKVYRCGIENIFWHYKSENKSALSKLRWHLKDRFNREMLDLAEKIVEKENPDIISCHNITGWSPSVWMAGGKKNIPTIEVLHDLYLLCPRSNMFKNNCSCKRQCLECAAFRVGYREHSRKLRAFVGVSNYIVERFRDNGYFSGVDSYVINNAREIPDPGKKIVEAAAGNIRFGYIGTINKAKGVEWLIDQFVSRSIPGKLLIAGSGDSSYVDELKRKAANSSISFLGYQNPKDFFSNIDVCIVPSMWPDTFPGVAYEACAYRVPVIASKIGGLPEIINEGVNGLYCNPDNKESLGDAMLKMSQDEKLINGLSDNCRVEVNKLLSRDRFINEYLSLYSSIST